jgi:hypothetical protein
MLAECSDLALKSVDLLIGSDALLIGSDAGYPMSLRL